MNIRVKWVRAFPIRLSAAFRKDDGTFVQRQYRLGANRQFNYVYRRGKRVSTKDLSLLYVSVRQKRVGFSVNKKVGVAVIRNRTKRRLRECIRPRLAQMKNGYYVFVARPSIASSSFQEINAQVDTLLKKLDSARNREAGK